MGLKEWFGVKQCQVKARSCPTLEDLFRKIKDLSFDAGEPVFYRNEKVIAFPALDENNQVQIFGGNGTYMVIRSTIPVAGSIMVSDPTSFGNASDRKKLCMDLCQKAADQLTAMGL